MEAPSDDADTGASELPVTALVALPDGAPPVRFPSIALPELAQSLRALLAEHPASAPFTSYRLEVALGGAPLVLTEFFDASDAEDASNTSPCNDDVTLTQIMRELPARE